MSPKQKIKWTNFKYLNFFKSLVNPKIKKEDQEIIAYKNAKALDSIYKAYRYYKGNMKNISIDKKEPETSDLDPLKSLEERDSFDP